MNEKEKWADSRCMELCSKSEKCISDIQKKLKDWEIEPEEAQKIIDQLVKDKFIDEKRFAQYYSRDKFRFNQWGKVKIAYMLNSKKLSPEYIQNAIDQIDEEDYKQMLLILLTEKVRKAKFINEYDKKGKLTRFALSHGFEYDLISKTLQSLK